MAKKSKNYVGPIPFDIWGNQLHYPQGYDKGVKATDFINGELWLERSAWNGDGYDRTVTKPYWSLAELGFEKFPEPVKYSHYDKEDSIGKIKGIVEVPNYEFNDELEYAGYSRGRSAAYFGFKSLTNGREYTMFLTDFEDVVVKLEKGVIKGRFTFCKRGANFGCKML